MPWIGLYEGEKKAPHQVPLKTDVECVECGERMRVWRRSKDGRARHFKHLGAIGGDGAGGTSACESVAESDIHLKWKSLAVDCLVTAFEGNIAGCSMEKRLRAPVSSKDYRDGDVVLEFDERDRQLGDGVVAEVQHKNESKDTEGTTRDYVEQGFSVAWLEADDFANDHCHLAEPDIRKRACKSVWPDHVPETSEWETQHEMVARDTDAWRNAKADEEVEYGATATLPSEWFDREAQRVWSQTNWWRIMERSGNRAASYRTQAMVPRVDTSRSTAVSLPPECVDTIRYEESDWESLFAAEHQQHGLVATDCVDLEFSPALPRSFWLTIFEEAEDREERARKDIEPPQTAHDDVQCHRCENYAYGPSASDLCPSCGTPYDWEWNVRTGRLSKESVPEDITLPPNL